ncbi:MAG: HAD-IA family hydrolase [Gemmatimonadaceae bacterium]|nr:HAD-IA family hydrolase [Gemmatimonadaceae bacterium]
MAPTRNYAVLFDLDGTLVDSIGLLIASMEYAYEGRALRPSVREWTNLIGTPLDQMLGLWAEDEADVARLRARYREHQLEHHDRMVTAYPGTVDSVRALHAEGFTLGVVTSKLETGARRALKLIGVEECFTTVVGIEATTRHKPEPEPVLEALSRLGVPAARAVFVGDSTHDMHAGNAAGVETAAVLWGPYSRTDLEPTKPRHWLMAMPEVVPLARMLATR